MSKCKEFLSFFDSVVEKAQVEVPDTVKEFYHILEASGETATSNKPPFTQNGAKILDWLQNQEVNGYKSKDISDLMGISSRTVSGAMRKLVTDGYVEKFGTNPVVYTITDKGKNINLTDYIN